jgi:hypothetical protein
MRRKLRVADVTRHHERVVHLVGGVGYGPGLLPNPLDGRGVERAQIVGAAHFGRAPRVDRAGAALLQRCVVEEGVHRRVEQLVAQHRGFRGIARHGADFPIHQALQHRFEPGGIDRLFQRIAQRLVHEGVVGNLAHALQVVLAGHRVGKHRLQQVLGEHALQLVGDARAAAVARHGERKRGAPAPAGLEDGRLQQRLHERLAHRVRMEVAQHLLQREGMHLAERKNQPLLGGGRLQLEVEALAELLAQGESPGPIDAAAEGRVQHELHAARLVEEALERDLVHRRHHSQAALGFAEVLRDLQRGRLAE